MELVMNTHFFKWAVIGAGPAGIATVGKLIDHGVDPKQIAWIDPEFKVGDFGVRWKNVPSNTQVKFFLKFFYGCISFEYSNFVKHFKINEMEPSSTCILSLAAEPLQWITEILKSKVLVFYEKAQKLKLRNRKWEINLLDSTIYAENVVLATGSEPKSLSLRGLKEISLETALTPEKLKCCCKYDDVIAVFGSSHSAILALKTLLEQCNISKVINFYQSPLRYAVYLDNWILFDNTGLKGIAADWARENLNGNLPDKLQRELSIDKNLQNFLPQCNKAIYATGFEKRTIPIEGMLSLECNNKNGIIAPGLFGIGIAFPEMVIDPYGNSENSVGLWKFMDYLERIIAIWLRYSL